MIIKNPIFNSRILITGGCGFIGSHVAKELALKYGVKELTVIDNLKYGNLNTLGKLPINVKLIKFNIGYDSSNKLDKALEDVDYVFHLAAEKHNQAKDNPVAIMKSNIDGTYQLLECAAKNKVKKVVFSSSLYIYGRMSGLPMQESDTPHPDTIYGISKLTGEQMLAYFYKEFGLAHTILRYFFVYGPFQFAGTGYRSVIVKNFQRIIANQSPVIKGDGKQILDYVYINDVVNVTIKAIDYAYNQETFNIASSEGISINELISLMLQVCQDKSLSPIFEKPDGTNGSFRVGNNQKAKRLLKFEPRVSLAKGLEATYNWLKQVYR